MKVVFVVGPTASGKSDLALKLAQKYHGAVVNCDSIQLYQGLDIGSAKPTASERQLCPHYLFDYVPLTEVMTAGRYRRDFFVTLEKIKEKITFVVGGTGFYFQAIEHGMFKVGPADSLVIAEVAQDIRLNPTAVYQELLQVDPLAASRISPADHFRLARAMEIWRTTKRPPSEIKQDFEINKVKFPYPLFKLGVWGDRETLLPRVERRTQAMLAAGLQAEVEHLVAEGYGDLPALQSVGYKEMLTYLKLPREQQRPEVLQQQITMATLQLAKKQRTWFKRDPQIHWQQVGGNCLTNQQELDQFLAGDSQR